jgi:hypothetical protein
MLISCKLPIEPIAKPPVLQNEDDAIKKPKSGKKN